MYFIAFVGLPSHAQEGNKALEPLDIFDMQWATDPQISPNGETVVYVRNRFDVMKDSTRRSLWSVSSDGKSHTPLAESPSSSPRWSSDGSRLAYVSSVGGKTQIHVRWMESDRDTAITYLQESPQSLSWSPDGKYLAFIQFVKTKKEPIAKLPPKPKGATWNSPPKVYEDLVYRGDGSGFSRGGFGQIFVVSATGGKPIQLTSKPINHRGPLSWSADGQRLYFSTNYSDDWQRDRTESDIYSIEIATSEVTRITDRDGSDRSPQVSPNGQWLAYLGSDDVGGYQTTKLYLTAISELAPKRLLELDRTISGLRWSQDNRALYVSYVNEGALEIVRVDLNGRTTDVTDTAGGTSIGRPYMGGRFSVARNGAVAHELNHGDQPANVGITTKGKTRQLTQLNHDWLGSLEINPPEEIWYESAHDGQKIQGWIVKPPGFDPEKKYPLILEIHGGPHTAYGNTFSAEVQLYAAAGYVVLYTNPRGSTGYGEEFAREIYLDYPGHDYDDLMSGVDAVIEQGYIDTKNLFVTGGSGGGILTAWIVSKTDRFAAAVSQKPVINWYTMTFVSDIGTSFWTNWFEALPWEDPTAYLEKSPINHVNKVKTPTMLITGEQDWRTPMSESEQFYQALQMNSVPTALVRIPNSSHSIAARPSGLIAKAAYVLGWFERYRSEENNGE